MRASALLALAAAAHAGQTPAWVKPATEDGGAVPTERPDGLFALLPGCRTASALWSNTACRVRADVLPSPDALKHAAPLEISAGWTFLAGLEAQVVSAGSGLTSRVVVSFEDHQLLNDAVTARLTPAAGTAGAASPVFQVATKRNALVADIPAALASTAWELTLTYSSDAAAAGASAAPLRFRVFFHTLDAAGDAAADAGSAVALASLPAGEYVAVLAAGKADAVAAATVAAAAAVGSDAAVGGPASAPTPLTDGLPLNDFVSYGASQYYTFQVPAPVALNARLDVVVVPVTGDPDLYIKLGGLLPARNTYDYFSSALFGTDSVVIRGNDSQVRNACGATSGSPWCTINILVYGWRASNFTVSISTQAVPTQLTPGLPFIDSVDANTYNFYSLQSSASTGNTLISFILTSTSGDADMYVSNSVNGNVRPTASTPYCAFSTSDSRDVVEIWPNSTCYCTAPCTYYVGVLGWNAPATYAIVGTEVVNAVVTLIDGQYENGFVGQGESDQYVFSFTPDQIQNGLRQVVEVSLTPWMGDADLFVTLDGRTPGPAPGQWDYRSISASGIDYVAIRSSDAVFKRSACGALPPPPSNSSCTITIASFGYTTAIYSIIASTSRYINLMDSRTVIDYVAPASFNYYRFVPSAFVPNARVVFTLSPLSNDPDLYIGSDAVANTTVPTTRRGTYVTRSVTLGNEVITINPTDVGYCTPGTNCAYYIGVYGFSRNATFALTARSVSNNPVPLLPGVPLAGEYVYAQEYNYYSMPFTTTPLQITVEPTYGDADLYVALDNRTLTMNNAQYASTVAGGGIDMVTVQASDPAYVANCTGTGKPCVANIAVYGFSGAGYTITASTGMITLEAGIQQYGATAAGQYTYFRFIATDTTSPITISLSPLAGDPDLFVSSVSAYPNMTNRQWFSNGFGAETVYITFTDSKTAACRANPPCVFGISVYGWGGPSTFTISASTSNSTTLVPDYPAQGFAPAWTFAYYVFYNTGSPNQPVEISATPLSGGDVSLYVNNVVSTWSNTVNYPSFTCHPTICPTTWSVANAPFTSVGSYSRERVLITPTTPGFTVGMYVIGVLSLGADASFSVVASVGGSSTVLTPGIPILDSVSRDGYNYYQVPFNTFGADLTVTVTPFNGDPDLFSSLTLRTPNSTTAAKRSMGGAGQVDAITWQWREMAPYFASSSGLNAYFSVYGYRNASYSIVATTINGTTPTYLVDGVPFSGAVGYRSYAYFVTRVSVPRGTSYSVYLRSMSGDSDLYLRTDGQVPSTTFFQLSSTRSIGDDIVTLRPGTRYYNASALLTIAVYGFTPNATFQITYSTAQSVVQIADGVTMTGSVVHTSPTITYNYYSFASSRGSAYFQLTSLTGDSDMFVSVWSNQSPSFRPSVSQSTWSSTAFGSDSISIPTSDPNACQQACQYIVAVMCATGSSCLYSLTATASTRSLVQLSDGQPLQATITQGTWRYYTFSALPDPTAVNVTFRAVPQGTGDVELYITNAYDNTQQPPVGSLPTNTPGGYMWSSASGGTTTGTGFVTLASNAPGVNVSNPTYTIGVFGVSGSTVSYTIVASTSAVTPSLVPGQPSTQHIITDGSNQVYTLFVDDATQDIVVSATVMEGGVYVAVSLNNPWTSCATNNGAGPAVVCNGTWATVGTATPSQLRIAANSPCSGPYVQNPATCDPNASFGTGTYYIAVFGASTAAASVSVTATAAAAAVVPLGAEPEAHGRALQSGTSTYTIAAYLQGSLSHLVDGTPTAASTTDSSSVTFDYTTFPDATLPDLRISIVADATPVTIYVNSCPQAQCTAQSSSPGPASFMITSTAPANGAADLFITKYMTSIYCAGSQAGANAGSACNYFITVMPATPCDTPSCTATFTIVAAAQTGSTTRVPYASVNNNLLTQPGSVAPYTGSAAYFELYLAAPSPVDITVTLDACGPGYPAAYICYQTPSGPRCANPYQPSATDNVQALDASVLAGTATVTSPQVAASNYFVAIAPSPSTSAEEVEAAVAAGGRGLLSLHAAPASAAERLQAAMAGARTVAAKHAIIAEMVEAAARGVDVAPVIKAPAAAGGSRALQAPTPPAVSTNIQYALKVSAGPTRVLWPSADASLSLQSSSTGPFLNVSWNPATVGTATSGPTATRAVGMQYLVYAAPGSFAASAATYATTAVPTTACGLIRYGFVASVQPVTVQNATWAVLSTLDPNQQYEINVVGVCDDNCWAINSLFVPPRAAQAIHAELVATAADEGDAATPAGKARALRRLVAKHAPSVATRVQHAVAAAAPQLAAMSGAEHADPADWMLHDLTDAEFVQVLAASASGVDAQDADAAAVAAVMRIAGKVAPAPGSQMPAAGAVEAATPAALGRTAAAGPVRAPGYKVQRVAYSVFNTATGGAGIAPVIHVLPPGGIAGISIAAVIIIAGILGFVCYRSTKRRDRQHQYSTLDVSGVSMDTISTPAKPGVFASLRNAFATPAPSRGGLAGYDGSVNGSDGFYSSRSAPGGGGGGLADASYSSIEDRAAGYL